MILNIRIQNYRSIKDKVEFTLIAESSKSKEDNIYDQTFSNGKESIRLLKTALIYGANASGKTNLLRSIFEIVGFIKNSRLNVGDNIDIYSPFMFSGAFRKKPTSFSIDFIGYDSIKYTYDISFNKTEIVKECLVYFPKGKSRELFSRIVKPNSKIHSVKSGSDLSNKEIEVFNNQSILSKFGKDIPHEIISDVFLYLTNIEVINACDSRKVSILRNEISKYLIDNSILKDKMDELISFADTGIKSIIVEEVDSKKLKFSSDIPEDIKLKILSQYKYVVAGIHESFNSKNKVSGFETIPFDEESHGSNTLYSLGGVILKSLENGTALFIDEIETGLHPFLSKLLICLFQNKRINKKNAQLVFTTHDTNLLDRSLFRKDQIWFTEKNTQGETDLYSLQDFNDVREDTPFDKWYMAGKFGGIPNIKSLESLFIKYE